MNNFVEFGLHAELNISLAKLNFVSPTPIQAEAIPVALQGKDVLGTSQTGTGKTGAFAIPLISHLLNNDKDAALVVAPTRELALQVMEVLKKFLNNNKIKTALLIGGKSISEQLNQMRFSPRIIVGTPGRINDHILRDKEKFRNIRFLVLDEVDRMLDMGFDVQIDRILEFLPKQKQTLMFSATLPDNIQKLANRYLSDPVRIAMKSMHLPENKIKQETIKIKEQDKYSQLLTQIEQREGSIIVFIKTKIEADKMAAKLRLLNHTADAMHGDLRQRQRDRVIRFFRSRKNRIMIATDVAARGLDIPHIEHVINYDLPHCPEDYIHRIGRTARAGATGSAINFVSPQDDKRWNAICRLIGIKNTNPQGEKKRILSPSRSRSNDSNRFTSSKRGKFYTQERSNDGQAKFNSSRKAKFFDQERSNDGQAKFNSSRKAKFFDQERSNDGQAKFNSSRKAKFFDQERSNDGQAKFNSSRKAKFFDQERSNDGQAKFSKDQKRSKNRFSMENKFGGSKQIKPKLP